MRSSRRLDGVLAGGDPLGDPLARDLWHGCVDAVPRVDRGDRKHERAELPTVVMQGSLLPDGVRDWVRAICEAGGGFGVDHILLPSRSRPESDRGGDLPAVSLR